MRWTVQLGCLIATSGILAGCVYEQPVPPTAYTPYPGYGAGAAFMGDTLIGAGAGAALGGLAGGNQGAAIGALAGGALGAAAGAANAPAYAGPPAYGYEAYGYGPYAQPGY